jgi:small Trp-rich protein
MWMVGVGVVLVVLYALDVAPVANWAWGWLLIPFAAAAAWWHFSDSTGLTQRRAIEKMERRKVERRDRALEALGLDHRREKQVARAREDAAERRTSADPTQADRSASEDPGQRRDPTR